MKKIIIVLLLSLLVLFGCSNETTSSQSSGDINNDALEKQTINGIVVSHTLEVFEEGNGQTTYLADVTLTNTTSEDITLTITGFGASSGNTIFGSDESLTEFTEGDYLIAADNNITFEVYYTIPSDIVIDEVLLYDGNYTQYIFE